MKKVFVSDCEGPISKNDNAFEATSHFVPNGDRLFTAISKYDDVLADVIKKPGHKAGNTLKFVLPFLKAYDVTDSEMKAFSAKILVLIANSKETLSHARKVMNAFIASTSYEHYIRVLCQAIDFPYENTYCTKLAIDKYSLTAEEKNRLKALAEEIVQMPLITIPSNAKSIQDFAATDQRTIRRLDEIFDKEMANMVSGKILSEVNPVGGIEKAEAVKDAVKRTGATLADVMYVGDSITDMEAFKLAKEKGGLAVSFNGNQYAVKNAEIAVLSQNSLVTAVIADVFSRFGKQQTLEFVENWSRETLDKSQANRDLIDRLLQLYPEKLPKVEIITGENMESLAKESSEFRKNIRGEAIGRLG